MKVISGEPICNSPLNHSKSKYMYSFGRAQRFPMINRYYEGSFFYNLPSMRMTRSTSIGYGTKYDFTRDAKSKSPVFYDFKSDFDQKNQRPHRYTFGLGRDRMYRAYDNSCPGPAKYNILRPFGKDGIKYTMRIKYNRTRSSDNIFSPGPGAYSAVTKINPNGTYIVSKNENVHPVEFSKDKSQRFNYHYDITPGPSDYKKETLFGKIFESKFRSTNGISMSPKFKIIDSRDCYPGPGAYRSFSEFGIYEKDDSKRTLKNNTRNRTTSNFNQSYKENKTKEK